MVAGTNTELVVSSVPKSGTVTDCLISDAFGEGAPRREGVTSRATMYRSYSPGGATNARAMRPPGACLGGTMLMSSMTG
jgi:hypothetical protein